MKAVVLLSGGLDSSTALAEAVSKFGANEVYALNIMYGQKHIRELKSAEKISAYYHVKYRLMDFAQVFSESNCALLVNSDNKIKHESYAEQLKELGGQGTVSTYVPFRNGLMLSAAVSFAQSIGANEVWYGAHKDDAAGRAYPDCTPEFAEAMGKAIYYGSGNEVRLYAPFMNINKAGIVAVGLKLKVPYELTWSCYEGGEHPCGQCGTCIDRHNAFLANGVVDPLEVPSS